MLLNIKEEERVQLMAGPPWREASGEWIETSSCRKKQQDKGVDHVHRPRHLQGKAEWSVPETSGAEEASHPGLSARWGGGGAQDRAQ